MCNLYNQTTAVQAMRGLFNRLDNRAGNIEGGDVYPDRMAPIITREGDGHVLRNARWGLPSPPQFHSKSGIDRGVTNVRLRYCCCEGMRARAKGPGMPGSA